MQGRRCRLSGQHALLNQAFELTDLTVNRRGAALRSRPLFAHHPNALCDRRRRQQIFDHRLQNELLRDHPREAGPVRAGMLARVMEGSTDVSARAAAKGDHFSAADRALQNAGQQILESTAAARSHGEARLNSGPCAVIDEAITRSNDPFTLWPLSSLADTGVRIFHELRFIPDLAPDVSLIAKQGVQRGNLPATPRPGALFPTRTRRWNVAAIQI